MEIWDHIVFPETASIWNRHLQYGNCGTLLAHLKYMSKEVHNEKVTFHVFQYPFSPIKVSKKYDLKVRHYQPVKKGELTVEGQLL